MKISVYIAELVKGGMADDAAKTLAKGQAAALGLVDDIGLLAKGDDDITKTMEDAAKTLDALIKGDDKDADDMPEKKDGKSDDDEGKEKTDEEVEAEKKAAEKKTEDEEGDTYEKAKAIVGDLLKAAKAEWIKDVEAIFERKLKGVEAIVKGVGSAQAVLLRSQSAIAGRLAKSDPLAPKGSHPGQVKVQPSPQDEAAANLAKSESGQSPVVDLLAKANRIVNDPESKPGLKGEALRFLRIAEMGATDESLMNAARAAGLVG